MSSLAEDEVDAVGDPLAAQARRLRRPADLRQADAYRGRMIGRVAHELRTPLTSILGHLDLLREGDLEPTSSEHVLDLLIRNAERMAEVLDDLLVLTRTREIPRPRGRVRVCLGDVVREAVELLAPMAADAEVAVTLDVPEQGPFVRGDQGELLRVVQNLLSNALKYGGDQVRLTVLVGATTVTLEVADRGIGIAPGDQARLFTEFFRAADPAVRAQPGTGLGLAIVERLVTAHGGTIAVDSAPGRGATFRVVLARTA
ncbi:MAG: HAMP domain-containing sensor histidine kinase [Nocardioides sp.]|uniref:sensor histidine kinase n=1 Tax=Nocardioides sp. TaxID=35761 RepID=UPI0039E5F28A